MHKKADPQTTLEEKVDAPNSAYDDPKDVLTDTTLSVEEKTRILESWLQDAKRLAESEAENMAGGEASRERELALALQELRASSA